MNQKAQTVTVTFPSGTEAGLYETTVKLDTKFTQCNGVAVYETGAGGIPNYKIGLKDDTATYQDLTHKNDWLGNTTVAPDHRYKTVSLPIDEQNMVVRTQIPAALTAELSFDVVFRLVGRKSR